MVEHAKELGWQDVRVIDEDLGRSGSGRVERRGFETLLSEVCQGKAGAVFAIEASRLARNGHDWHKLLEFCQIVDTLIVDHDGIYDPKHPNDRLILGLKGTMSEVELSMFRQRSQEAIRQKASRGEYFARVAEGYLLREGGRLERDPDERVQRAIGLVFEKFRELGSARQIQLWFRQEEIKLPKRIGPRKIGLEPDRVVQIGNGLVKFVLPGASVAEKRWDHTSTRGRFASCGWRTAVRVPLVNLRKRNHYTIAAFP